MIKSEQGTDQSAHLKHYLLHTWTAPEPSHTFTPNSTDCKALFRSVI